MTAKCNFKSFTHAKPWLIMSTNMYFHCIYIYIYIYIYCETWIRLCQAHCQENERKVPESPLLTARRRGLTVYATPWSQKRGRHFGSLSFFRQYCGPVFGAGFWPHFWDHERANRSCSMVLTARISSICWRQLSFCNASRQRHTHPYDTVYIYIYIWYNILCLFNWS